LIQGLIMQLVEGFISVTLFQSSVTTTTTIANITSGLGNIFSTMITNPYVAASVILQLILGIALGYVSVKVLKYILAFIGILILGAFLNVWSLGSGSLESALKSYYSEFKQVEPLIKKLLTTLGILTVGPVSVGYIIGILIGIAKK
jgi:hypothetical protein